MPEEDEGTSTEVVEPTGEETPEEETLDSVKATLRESQELNKRYKEQVSGSQSEAQKLKERVSELESVESDNEGVAKEELSKEDSDYANYLKKVGMVPKAEVEKMIQTRLSPFEAKETAKNKKVQQEILDDFVGNKPQLSSEKDIDGTKMQKVVNMLKRITPSDPFDPNSSLKEDLELAYGWAFKEDKTKEAIDRAKAEGRAEGHEASDIKVGSGASSSSTSKSNKNRSPEQEALLKDWGVNDESYNKEK